jgi:hypothetical protein
MIIAAHLTSGSRTVATATHSMIIAVHLTSDSPTVATTEVAAAQYDYSRPHNPGFPFRRNSNSGSNTV